MTLILHKRSHACSTLCHVKLDGAEVNYFYAVEGPAGFVAFTEDLPCGGQFVRAERGRVDIELDHRSPPWARRWWEFDRENILLSFKPPDPCPVLGAMIPVTPVVGFALPAELSKKTLRNINDTRLMKLDPIGVAKVVHLEADRIVLSISLDDSRRGRLVRTIGAGYAWGIARVTGAAGERFECTVALDSLFNMWQTHHDRCDDDGDDEE